MSRTAADLEEAMRAATTAFELRPFMAGDDDYGPCPCFTIDLPDFRAEGHCWRTSYRGEDGVPCSHRYVGLHVWGNRVLGRLLAALLTASDWYGEWPLEVEGRFSGQEQRDRAMTPTPPADR
jgi:hypothetical protein